MFVRTDELHRQRAYGLGEVRECLGKEGLSCIKIYDAFTRDAPTQESERVYFVVRK